MKDTRRYWNPLLETLSREKLQALQLKKFRRIFQWAYDNSKFLRSLYDEARIKPDDIRSFEDIENVPKVEKAMLRSIQSKNAFPLWRSFMCPSRRGNCISPNQWNFRPACLYGGHMAGLGIMVRVLVLYPLGTGISTCRPHFHPVWVQCFCCLLGGTLCCGKDRL